MIDQTPVHIFLESLGVVCALSNTVTAQRLGGRLYPRRSTVA
jgi:hypothetical protein